MWKRLLVWLVVLVGMFSGYVYGQKDVRPFAGAPTVFAGDDFGFRAQGQVGDPANGRGWVTGSFVVKVGGHWVEARLGGGPSPAVK